MADLLVVMHRFFDQFETAISAFQAHLPLSFTLMAVLIGVHLINCLMGYRLNCLGIRPRRIEGIIGIPCMVFLHGDFNHLFFNLIPFFVLVNMVMLKGWDSFVHIGLLITVLTGTGIWLFGRRAIHVGVSGVNLGFLGFLLTDAYLQPSLVGGITMFVLIYYFASMLFDVLPTRERVSWEGHLIGLIVGGVLAYWY